MEDPPVVMVCQQWQPKNKLQARVLGDGPFYTLHKSFDCHAQYLDTAECQEILRTMVLAGEPYHCTVSRRTFEQMTRGKRWLAKGWFFANKELPERVTSQIGVNVIALFGPNARRIYLANSQKKRLTGMTSRL